MQMTAWRQKFQSVLDRPHRKKHNPNASDKVTIWSLVIQDLRPVTGLPFSWRRGNLRPGEGNSNTQVLQLRVLSQPVRGAILEGQGALLS
jgi:hypothetical protein